MVECLRRDHLHCYGYRRDTCPNLDKLVSAPHGVLWTQSESVAADTAGTFRVLGTYIRTATRAGVPVYLFSGNGPPALIGLGDETVKRMARVRTWPRMFQRPNETTPSAHELVAAIQRSLVGRDNFWAICHYGETHCPYESHGREGAFLFDALYEEHRVKWPPLTHTQLVQLDTIEGLLIPSESYKLREVSYNSSGVIASTPSLDNSILVTRWTRSASRKKDKLVAIEPAYYIAAYDGAIRFVDEAISQLVTLFPDAEHWVTGDHGEGFFDTGTHFCCHGYGLMPELRAVPAIVHTRQRPLALYSHVHTEPVTHENIYAAILHLFGLCNNLPGVPWPVATPEIAKRLAGLGYIDTNEE